MSPAVGKSTAGIIGTQPRISARQCRVNLQNPGPNVPDGDGGYTQTWVDLSPPNAWVHIETALREGEREAASAVITTVRRTVRMPFHPQVTSQTRILYLGRILHVDKVENVEERNVELVLTCEEVTP